MENPKKRDEIPSITSPIGGKMACLCKNGTYHVKCCKGLILNQRIGSDKSGNTHDYSVVGGQNVSNAVTNTNTQRVLINNSNAVDFTCSDIGASFSVADTGAISISLTQGTLVSQSVSSFPLVSTTTSRSVDFSIKAPQGFANEESIIVCTLTADQNAPSMTCSDLTISGFAISDAGAITDPTVTVTSSGVSCSFTKSPSSYAVVTTDTVQTLTLTITVPSGFHNTGSTITCTTTATQLRDTFECSLTTLSGFAVSQTGVITLPITSVGTIASSSPSSFAIVDTNTTRTLSLDITVPSAYLNEGQTVTCTTTATQPLTPTFTCSDVTLTGFAVSQAGVVTLPSLSTGTIASSSPSSFAIVDTNTTRTLSVVINVPAGYFNTGSTVTCTTTATQTATPTFSCSDVTLSGFAVSSGGVITAPTVDVGTLVSTSPASFDSIVYTVTSRTLNATITAPSGYFNAGSNIVCTTTANQPLTTLTIGMLGTLSDNNPLVFDSSGGRVHNANFAQYNRNTGLFEDRDSDSVQDSNEPDFDAFVNTTFGFNNVDQSPTYNNYGYTSFLNPNTSASNLLLSTSTATIQVLASVSVPSSYANSGSSLSGVVGNVTRPALMGNIHKVWTFTADYTQFSTYRITTTINGSTSVSQDLVLKGCTTLHSQTTPVVVSGRTDNPTFTDSGSTSTSWGCANSSSATLYFSPNSSSEADTFAANDVQSHQDRPSGTFRQFRVKSIVDYCNFTSAGVDGGIVGATIYNKLLITTCQGANEFTRQSESVTAFPDGNYSTTSASGAVSSGVVTSMS